jgi:hypothetical protein
LVAICKEQGLKGYSSKTKADLVKLLTDEVQPVPNETNLTLFQECVRQHSIKEVAETLNLCIGTVKRWLEKGDVPLQYSFDLQNLIGRQIDYSQYSSTLKDQFFTPPTLARHCWETFQREIPLTLDDYTFVEPSAGSGSFLELLPQGSIGLDIEPRAVGVEQADYLQWQPTDPEKKYIVFGNPPFGLRGHAALKFINHSATYADYVCFILPQLFESDGKGSPRKRVKGLNLVYSETLSALFFTPENQNVKINGVFQIWSKHTTNPQYDIKTNTAGQMKVYSLSDGGTASSTRNKDMLERCDVYIPSTCFGKGNMKVYDRFDELPGRKGYGVVFFTDRERMVQKAKAVEWADVSFLSTNSAYNLRMSMILAQLG